MTTAIKLPPFIHKALIPKCETLSIVVKISRAACEKLAQLQRTNSCSEPYITLGTNGPLNEKFNPEKRTGIPLIRVSGYFLGGRLTAIHDEENKPDFTSEPVAPVIKKHTKLVPDSLRIPPPYTQCDLLHEREVANLDELNVEKIQMLKNCNLKDLKAWLIIYNGTRESYYKFRVRKTDEADSRNGFVLKIDFDGNDWKPSQSSATPTSVVVNKVSSTAKYLAQSFKMDESAFEIETKYDDDLRVALGEHNSWSGLLSTSTYGLTHLGEPSERDVCERIDSIGSDVLYLVQQRNREIQELGGFYSEYLINEENLKAAGLRS